MKKYLKYCLTAFVLILCGSAYAQDIKDLTIKEKIDDTYVFGFDLTESRSAKGGIWNVKTGKAETPLSYTRMKKDTVDGKPVVMLYREVALGNHPLNRWETWVLKEGKWIDAEEDTAVDAQEEKVIFYDNFSNDEVGKAPKNWTHSFSEADSIGDGEIRHSWKPIRQPELKVVMKGGAKALTYVPGLNESIDYRYLPFEPVEINKHTSETGTSIYPAIDGEKVQLPNHYKFTLELYIADSSSDNINYMIMFTGHCLDIINGKGSSREAVGSNLYDGVVNPKLPVKPNSWNELTIEYDNGEVKTTINGKSLPSYKKDTYKKANIFAIEGPDEKLVFIKSLKIVEL